MIVAESERDRRGRAVRRPAPVRACRLVLRPRAGGRADPENPRQPVHGRGRRIGLGQVLAGARRRARRAAPGWLARSSPSRLGADRRLAAKLTERARQPRTVWPRPALSLRRLLRASAFGLAEIVAILAPDAPRLILVVDQFEELFRYGEEARGGRGRDARGGPSLRRAAADRRGHAARPAARRPHHALGLFRQLRRLCGLAEAVSASQYLVPVPDRDQLEAAIRGPVAKADARSRTGSSSAFWSMSRRRRTACPCCSTPCAACGTPPGRAAAR